MNSRAATGGGAYRRPEPPVFWGAGFFSRNEHNNIVSAAGRHTLRAPREWRRKKSPPLYEMRI